MRKTNIDYIFERIREERDYQDLICTTNNMTTEPTVEGELVMLKTYIDKTLQLWTKNNDKEKILSEFRKIAGITIRGLENHGCPKRNLTKDYTKNTL